MKKIALHWKILIGMLLGVVIGLIGAQIPGGSEVVQDWNLKIKRRKKGVIVI